MAAFSDGRRSEALMTPPPIEWPMTASEHRSDQPGDGHDHGADRPAGPRPSCRAVPVSRAASGRAKSPRTLAVAVRLPASVTSLWIFMVVRLSGLMDREYDRSLLVAALASATGRRRARRGRASGGRRMPECHESAGIGVGLPGTVTRSASHVLPRGKERIDSVQALRREGTAGGVRGQ